MEKERAEDNLASELGLQKASYEGGSLELTIKQCPNIDDINEDAKIRERLRQEVIVCSAYRTLFYGLKWN